MSLQNQNYNWAGCLCKLEAYDATRTVAFVGRWERRWMSYMSCRLVEWCAARHLTTAIGIAVIALNTTPSASAHARSAAHSPSLKLSPLTEGEMQTKVVGMIFGYESPKVLESPMLFRRDGHATFLSHYGPQDWLYVVKKNNMLFSLDGSEPKLGLTIGHAFFQDRNGVIYSRYLNRGGIGPAMLVHLYRPR